ncbi:MAG: PQQ-binding-like beta-propeller repeat protein [Gemmataceae bacterium]|nr:PQQ-binding-like beta-propeller repeat protein [Gemmataceae bacterium]
MPHSPGIRAADWPHWRGPTRNGLSPEPSGYQNGRWNIDKAAWHTNVGKGCSTPIVVGDKLYTMGWKSGKDHVVCLDAASGKQVWSQSYPCPLFGRKALGDQNQYAGPSSTPEYDAATGHLFTLSTDGDLCCWDTKNRGAKVWGVNLHAKYKVQQRPQVASSGHRDYGFTTAPLVYGDWLLVEVGAAEGTVIAFDKGAGREAWRSELKEPAGHTGSVVPMTMEGVPCLAVLTHFHLAVLRLDKGNEGKTVARHPWVTEFANSIATPAVQGPYVLVTSAYNQMKLCKLKITSKGAEKIWETKNPSGVCSPVIHKGRVYLAWRTIRCVDFETGKLIWSGENVGYPGSCIVTADDRLIVWGKSGELFLAETAARSPTKLTLLANNNHVLGDLAWPHVVLANGRLYCKDRTGALVCFQIAKSGD